MNGKEEMLHALRNLSLDRTAVRLMGEDISRLEEDEKQKELPAVQREALDKERGRLSACLNVTVHQIECLERLLSLLSPEERQILEQTLVDPRPGAIPALAAKHCCDASRIYRIRARALSKLTRLRYGAGE